MLWLRRRLGLCLGTSGSICPNTAHSPENREALSKATSSNFPPTTTPPNMATELTVQSERAYQKQPHIFQNHKGRLAKSRRAGKARRWYKDVGLGFRTPKTAIEGEYIGTAYTLMESLESTAMLTDSRRQEVPLCWSGLNSRPYPHRNCRVHQDAPYLHHPP